MKCSFCGRINNDDIAYLIAGPEDNNICDKCLLKIAEGILARDSLLRESVACSFCGIKDRKLHGIGLEDKTTICSQCTLKALQTISNRSESCHAMANKVGDRIYTSGYYSGDYSTDL